MVIKLLHQVCRKCIYLIKDDCNMKEFYYIWCERTAKNQSRFILNVLLSGTLIVMNTLECT